MENQVIPRLFALSLLNSCIHPQFCSWDKVLEVETPGQSCQMTSNQISHLCLLGPWATEFPAVMQIKGQLLWPLPRWRRRSARPTTHLQAGLKVTYSKAGVFHPLSLWVVCFQNIQNVPTERKPENCKVLICKMFSCKTLTSILLPFCSICSILFHNLMQLGQILILK